MAQIFNNLDDVDDHKAPTDDEILKDLGVDLPDEEGDLRPGDGSKERGFLQICCACCPCCAEDEDEGVAVPPKKAAEPQHPLQLAAAAEVSDADARPGTEVVEIDAAARSRSGRMDSAAQSQKAAAAEAFVETMRGEAERALVAVGFTPANSKALSAKMTAAPALGASETEVERLRSEALPEDDRKTAEAAGLTDVATIGDLTEQLVLKRPELFRESLLGKPPSGPSTTTGSAPSAAASYLPTLLSESAMSQLTSGGLRWLSSTPDSGVSSTASKAPGDVAALEKEVQEKVVLGATVPTGDGQAPSRRLGLLESVTLRRAISDSVRQDE